MKTFRPAKQLLLKEKKSSDYQRQKQFVENTSHELQTPLAVIKSKLELLIQSERLGEEEMILVASTLSSVGKLSKIIRSLILLSKIENKQFKDDVDIDLEQKCYEILNDFSEGLRAKNIQLKFDAINQPVLRMPEMLADVMITNLIKNAISHNIENGELNICLQPGLLSVENSGKPLEVPVSNLFKRFYSQSNNEDSVGLGLAIVKQICKLHKFDLKYTYADLRHKITIRF